VFKLGVGNDLGIPRSGSILWFKGLCQGHMVTVHNYNTSFRTTIAFDSHSLDGNTSTITLQPHIVIRYSLGGDTDKSNILRGFALYEYILVLDVAETSALVDSCDS